jgi:hypothetical protein
MRSRDAARLVIRSSSFLQGLEPAAFPDLFAEVADAVSGAVARKNDPVDRGISLDV